MGFLDACMCLYVCVCVWMAIIRNTYLILQAALFTRMHWAVPPGATSADYRVLPAGRNPTITTPGTFAVFVLATARCFCLLTAAYIRHEVFFPSPEYDVRLYEDSDHDACDPGGKSFREICFAKHFPGINRGAPKAQVRKLEKMLFQFM